MLLKIVLGNALISSDKFDLAIHEWSGFCGDRDSQAVSGEFTETRGVGIETVVVDESVAEAAVVLGSTARHSNFISKSRYAFAELK